MNRRKFLNATATAAMVGGLPARVASLSPKALGLSDLGGLSLKQLREQYRSDLFADFLPFMDKYVIDHELGGFMCNTDHQGVRVNQNKLSWFEGRGTSQGTHSRWKTANLS